MRTAALLLVLLALPASALAIEPRLGGEAAPEAGEPARVRARREAREEFRRVREQRREAFLAAAEEFAGKPAPAVPGWSDGSTRPARLTPEEGDDPLNLGGTLLLFSGITAVLVLLIRFPPNRWPFWPGARDGRRPESRDERRRRRDGPMTVKLEPRKRRWSGTSSRS